MSGLRRHRWTPEITVEFGEPITRHRCARCAVLSIWPGAREACDGMERCLEDPVMARTRSLRNYHERKRREREEAATMAVERDIARLQAERARGLA